MLNKKIYSLVSALLLCFGLSLGGNAYAGPECGKFVGKGVEKIMKGVLKEATKACKRGTANMTAMEAAAFVNDKRVTRHGEKGVKRIQKGIDKEGASCPLTQMQLDALAASITGLPAAAASLAATYCVTPP